MCTFVPDPLKTLEGILARTTTTLVAQPCAWHEEQIAVRGGEKWREVCKANGWGVQQIDHVDFEQYGLHVYGPKRCADDRMLHEGFLITVPVEDAERALEMMSGWDFDVFYAITA